MPTKPIQTKYESSLDRQLRIVIAGMAGKKINSAAALFCRGAVLSGLWASQRNDYPVTVKSGHSISEVILAPKEISYTGITRPDIMLLLFKEGLTEVRSHLAAMSEKDSLFINSDLVPIRTQAKLIPINFKQTDIWLKKKEFWAIIALARVLHEMQIYPLEAFMEAVSVRPEFAKDNLAAIKAGEDLSLETI